ncbi:[FeFe] hydrogenase H-cluster radical SAM maturase HydG [Candidatus Omnitrophota bacterium]
MKSFIDETKIENILRERKDPPSQEVSDIIERALHLEGLTLEETAALLQCEDDNLIEKIFDAARDIKESIYGNRLVLFAPLYVNNYCVNNCLYCGFRRDNKDLKRIKLDLDEIKDEVESLEDQGHKRILLVAGEDPSCSNMDALEDIIGAIYKAKKGKGVIRRVNVNVAPLSTEDFRRLKKTAIGTYQLFQETYHPETYKKMHPEGPKNDYSWRLYAMDRAQEAGIDDVGIGVLFGLYDYKFEVMALLAHSFHLEEEFGVGPHTISVPRLQPAFNTPLSENVPHPLTDKDFKKLVAVIRLAVPYTGIILSTREPKTLRDELFDLGVSQISAGSRTKPGAYAEDEETDDGGQFYLHDTRTQLQIVKDMLKKGVFPSFCTACYRTGRTGKDFMDLAKPGDIKNYCLPNCILTFKEYVLDYGDDELKEKADGVIDKEVEKIPSPQVREKTKENLKKLESGERDMFF